MIALEVSSAAGRPPFGGVGGTIRNLVTALLQLDPDTRYMLCYRFSRWRKGRLFAPDAPNAQIRVLQDPCNGWQLRGARLLHSMGVYLPRTPSRLLKLVTIHDLNPIRNPQWVTKRWREQRGAKIRKTVARADHVITYSEFTAAEIREEWGLPAERVHPVALGVDCESFRPLTLEERSDVRRHQGDYVLSIGLLTPRKNFVRLVEAMRSLPSLRLIVVGRPSNGADAFFTAVETARLGDRVSHLTSVPHAELVRLIGGAVVTAVPSLYEGFGLTVLEAMACGSPVVCSGASSLPEVAGDAACLVDAGSAEALSDAIARVANDSELAEAMRSRGLARARACSWDRSANRLRALYAELGGV